MDLETSGLPLPPAFVGESVAISDDSWCGAVLRDHLKTRSSRHPREGGGPEIFGKSWIPVFTGVTINEVSGFLR